MEGGSLKHIGPSAFMFNRFKEVDLGDVLTSIGDGAFAYPKYKFGIHVPHTIEHIGANAFKNNVILNPNNLKANIASIDIDFNKLSTVLGIEVSSDFLAENKQGFSDGTVVSATVEGSNPFNSFAFVYNGMMNFCP